MFTLIFASSYLSLKRDEEDIATLNNLPSDFTNKGVRYGIREFSFFKDANDIYYIPKRQLFNSNFESFKRRVDLFNKVKKLFDTNKIPYTIEIVDNLNITNRKGNTYAYLL